MEPPEETNQDSSETENQFKQRETYKKQTQRHKLQLCENEEMKRKYKRITGQVVDKISIVQT